MARWLMAFDVRQFHFVSGEQLVVNPVDELHKVETFLGLEHRINESMFYFNESRGFYCIRAPPIAVAVGGANFSAGSGQPDVVTGRTSNFPHESSLSTMEDGTSVEVDNRVTPISPDRCLASSKGRVHPNISHRVIQKLRKFFRPYSELFYKQTEINFGWPTT
jgi:hypothetical protein